MSPRTRSSSSPDQILDAAQHLAQSKGYNAFSYRDLAKRVGIRTSSIHYHFPTKGDLGRALVRRYREQFATAIELIEAQTTDPVQQLQLYTGLFRQTLVSQGKLCLCGMLAADFSTLPAAVRKEVGLFFAENERWLTSVISDGQSRGTLRPRQEPGAVAAGFLAALEGIMLASRALEEMTHFDRTSSWLLQALKAP